MLPRIDIGFHSRTRQELVRSSPSMAEGYSEAREGILRRQQMNILMMAGQLLSMCFFPLPPPPPCPSPPAGFTRLSQQVHSLCILNFPIFLNAH